MSKRYVPLDAPVIRITGDEILPEECPVCGADPTQCCSAPDGTEYSSFIHEARFIDYEESK
jgi:hypothetical protein